MSGACSISFWRWAWACRKSGSASRGRRVFRNRMARLCWASARKSRPIGTAGYDSTSGSRSARDRRYVSSASGIRPASVNRIPSRLQLQAEGVQRVRQLVLELDLRGELCGQFLAQRQRPAVGRLRLAGPAGDLLHVAEAVVAVRQVAPRLRVAGGLVRQLAVQVEG